MNSITEPKSEPNFEFLYGLVKEKRYSISPSGEGRIHTEERSLARVTRQTLSAIQRTQSIRNSTERSVEAEELKKEFSERVHFSPWEQPHLKKEASDIQKLAFQLIRGELPHLSALPNKSELLEATLWKRNDALLKECRELIKELLRDIFHSQSASLQNEEHFFYMEIITGELLSLLPFLRPEKGERFSVPVREENQWRLISYEVQRLELTPRSLGSPIVAYALVPEKGAERGPPILLFKGTTYPSDEGFFLSLMTDLNPWAPVGGYAFRLGKEKIAEWLEKETRESKALIYGKSLGGSLAWQTALAFPDRVERVMTYGSPGFSKQAVKQLEELSEGAKPRLHFFCQENDPVPFFGEYAPSGVQYYEIIAPSEEWGVKAHASMFSTWAGAMVIALDPSQIAAPWKRRLLNLIRDCGAFLFFCLAIIQMVALSVVTLRKWIKKAVWINSKEVALYP